MQVDRCYQVNGCVNHIVCFAQIVSALSNSAPIISMGSLPSFLQAVNGQMFLHAVVGWQQLSVCSTAGVFHQQACACPSFCCSSALTATSCAMCLFLARHRNKVSSLSSSSITLCVPQCAGQSALFLLCLRVSSATVVRVLAVLRLCASIDWCWRCAELLIS